MKPREKHRDLVIHTSTKDLSRAAPAERFVACKTGMGPISSASQELRSSSKEEQK